MTTVATRQRYALKLFWSGEGNLSYLIHHPETREAVLIDPDLEILGTYLLTLDRESLTLKAVIDTHNHAEHATAGPALRQLTGAAYLMRDVAPSSYVSDHVRDGDERILAGLRFKFYAAPGHTPCMTIIQLDNDLFTGDSLFLRSSGRPDLPGGDAGQQFDTLQMILHRFPDETVIRPGHDYNHETHATLGQVRKNNPRLQFSSREAFIDFNRQHYQNEEKPDDLAYYVAFNAR